VIRAYRLKKVQGRFLESCRLLRQDRAWWGQIGGWARWFLEALSPVPVLAMHEGANGLWQALQWLEANAKQEPLSETVLKRYHSLLMGGTGEYRKHKATVVGSGSVGVPPQKIGFMMLNLGTELRERQEEFDRLGSSDRVFQFSVSVHHRVGWIHPFGDGNGRVARLAMNHLLRRYGLGYVVFPPLGDASPLWEALEEANRGDLGSLTSFARRCLYRV
jgi:hypothetical protein